jgi:hypothetical protein
VNVPLTSSTLTRRSHIRTLTAPTTAFIRSLVAITVSAGAPVDATIIFGWPQLELGAFATSPIRTTTVAVTRAADVVTVTTVPAFGSAHTLFSKGRSSAFDITRQMLAVDDNSSINRNRIGQTLNTVFGDTTTANVSQDFLSDTKPAVDTTFRAAYAAATNDFAFSLDARTVLTDAVGNTPSGISRVGIGNGPVGTQIWNGYIERIALWPATRLSNADLRRITR